MNHLSVHKGDIWRRLRLSCSLYTSLTKGAGKGGYPIGGSRHAINSDLILHVYSDHTEPHVGRHHTENARYTMTRPDEMSFIRMRLCKGPKRQNLPADSVAIPSLPTPLTLELRRLEFSKSVIHRRN